MVRSNSSDSPVSGTKDGRSIPVAAMVESIIGCKWSLGILDFSLRGVIGPAPCCGLPLACRPRS